MFGNTTLVSIVYCLRSTEIVYAGKLLCFKGEKFRKRELNFSELLRNEQW